MEQPKYRNLSIKCDNIKQLKTTLYKDEESLQSKDKVSLSRIVLELLFPPNDDLAFFFRREEPPPPPPTLRDPLDAEFQPLARFFDQQIRGDGIMKGTDDDRKAIADHMVSKLSQQFSFAELKDKILEKTNAEKDDEIKQILMHRKFHNNDAEWSHLEQK